MPLTGALPDPFEKLPSSLDTGFPSNVGEEHVVDLPAHEAVGVDNHQTQEHIPKMDRNVGHTRMVDRMGVV